MAVSEGYRLKARSVAEVSAILDDYRAEALRLLARSYGRAVAELATAQVDLRSLGLPATETDPVSWACGEIAAASPSSGGVTYPEFNCVIDLHFADDAVLAVFVHGGDAYRKAWESRGGVVRWAAGTERPQGLSEASWEKRRKYWSAVAARKGLGDRLRFALIADALPRIGWGGIRRYLPLWEDRLAASSRALRESDPALTHEDSRAAAAGRLARDLTRESFVPAAHPQRKPRSPAPEPTQAGAGKEEESPAQRMRSEAAKARRERSAAASRPANGRAASIDHADIVVSSDGRTFVAAPHVGLDVQNRVFIQVGDSHVAVSQGGVQYGYVTDVQKSAIDHLRHCRTVTLVEVERVDGRRLLKAKHVAIVSDISLGESVNVALGGFRRPRTSAGDREIREWDSRE